MKFNRPNNWETSFRHDGILYFAQRIQEMLFHYTSHVYKCPVLNTKLLVEEYINTFRLVKQQVINENHLKYIMEEFQETFLNDLIVQDNINSVLRNTLLKKLNSSSLQEQERTMEYILYLLKDYNAWCREYVSKIVLHEKEKKKIDRALRSYIPSLIGDGYAHEYIYYYTNETFFKQPVNSAEVLTTFLNRFDFRKRNYDVYIAVDKHSLLFKDVLSERFEVEFEQEQYAQDFKYDAEKYSIVKICIYALDEPNAARAAYDRLNVFFKYYQFVEDYRDDWLMNTAKIVDEDGEKSFLNLKPDGLDFYPQVEEHTAGNFSNYLFTLLFRNARESLPVIDRAVDIHNLAIADNSINNAFLNLWSVFEILFVSDQDDSKINEIERKILPILQKDYINLVFHELYKYFSEVVPDDKQRDIRERVTCVDATNEELWFYFLLVLPKYRTLREEIYSLLSDYPLIRSRIYQLAASYSKRESLLADINRFERRLTWHLKRLYRTRNTIIHSGEVPASLKELGEHLHSYVDECLLEVAVLLAKRSHLRTIDNVVLDVQFQMQLISERLKVKGQIEESDIRFVFSDTDSM